MREIEVRVVSLEEADHGTAGFWLGQLSGFTRLEEGELVLTIEPSDDGRAVSVNAHSLYDAFAEAKRLSSPIEERRDVATGNSRFTRVVDRMEEAGWPAVTRPGSPPSERKMLCKRSPSVTATLVWVGCP